MDRSKGKTSYLLLTRIFSVRYDNMINGWSHTKRKMLVITRGISPRRSSASSARRVSLGQRRFVKSTAALSHPDYPPPLVPLDHLQPRRPAPLWKRCPAPPPARRAPLPLHISTARPPPRAPPRRSSRRGSRLAVLLPCEVAIPAHLHGKAAAPRASTTRPPSPSASTAWLPPRTYSASLHPVPLRVEFAAHGFLLLLCGRHGCSPSTSHRRPRALPSHLLPRSREAAASPSPARGRRIAPALQSSPASVCLVFLRRTSGFAISGWRRCYVRRRDLLQAAGGGAMCGVGFCNITRFCYQSFVFLLQ